MSTGSDEAGLIPTGRDISRPYGNLTGGREMRGLFVLNAAVAIGRL